MSPAKKLGIGAFVLADVALLFLAWNHVTRTPETDDLPDVPTLTATPAAGQADYDFNPAAARVMALDNDDTVAYAVRGECRGDERASLHVSTDGGKSFADKSIDLRVIAAIDVAGNDITVVGAAGDCDTVQLSSTDGGDSFTADDGVTLWHVAVDDAETVVLGDRSAKPGCEVTSLSRVGETFARVSCADGAVKGTGDGGREWSDLGQLDNIRVLTYSTFNRGFALARYQGCAAQEFSTDDGGRTWNAGGCITGDPAEAIAVNDLELAALVGGLAYTSTDDGESFTPAG